MFRKKVQEQTSNTNSFNLPTPQKKNNNNNNSNSNSSSLTQISETGLAGPTTPPKPPKIYLDDFGRVDSRPPAAFSSHRREDFGKGGYGIGSDEEVEHQLIYGYTPLSTQLEFDSATLVSIVSRCTKEIRARGRSSIIL